MSRPLPSSDHLVGAVASGDRVALARAITLVESRKPEHRLQAQKILGSLPSPSPPSWRIGVTGVPGVGKSTFIEAFGKNLTADGKSVAVLAVDPSSRRTGGSILGDKTRMPSLANDPAAFVRPSPSAGTLGGVNRMTRETMLLCEAAGFEVVLVETVGVGQSETIVADMVDFFLVLMLPGAGDELQGIKKGIIELADMVAVNKAEGDNAVRADQAAAVYRNALSILSPSDDGWRPPVVLCSGLTGMGLEDIWTTISAHRDQALTSGTFQDKRSRQHVGWMWSMIEEGLMDDLLADPSTRDFISNLERDVAAGTIPAPLAADQAIAQRSFGIDSETAKNSKTKAPKTKRSKTGKP